MRTDEPMKATLATVVASMRQSTQSIEVLALAKLAEAKFGRPVFTRRVQETIDIEGFVSALRQLDTLVEPLEVPGSLYSPERTLDAKVVHDRGLLTRVGDFFRSLFGS